MILRKQGIKTYIIESHNFFVTESELNSVKDSIHEEFITLSSSSTQNIVNFSSSNPHISIDPILNPINFLQSLPSPTSQSLLLSLLSKLHDQPILAPLSDFPRFLKSLHYSSPLELLESHLPPSMSLPNNMILYLSSSFSSQILSNLPTIKEPKPLLPLPTLNREAIVCSIISSLLS